MSHPESIRADVPPLPRKRRSGPRRRRYCALTELLWLGVLGCIIGAGTIALWLMSLTVTP